MASFSNPSRPFSRRRILSWGGAGAAGGLASYLGWSASAFASAETPPPASPPAGATVGREIYLPHLKSKFRLSSAALAATDCTLVEVGATRRSGSPAAEFNGFSLLFTAAAGFAGESAIYQVSHPELGAIELFLSPVGRSADQVTLEAVFSQRA